MLARVAVIGLGAVLLVTTAYLVVQVNTGPRGGEASLSAAARGRAGAAAASGERTGAGGEPTGGAAATPAAATAGSSGATSAAGVPGPSVEPLGSPAGAPAAASPTATTPASANLTFDEANKLYDRRDYEEARALALSLLREHTTSVRMRRIVVASSCIMGDHDVAQQHYLLLPEKDRGDMRLRCIPYGSAFREQ